MPVQTAVQRLQCRRTKIVATVGPASDSPELLAELIEAGVDVFRLNLSHGDHESHRRSHDRIREAAEEAGLPVAVLADLAGPKIRVGRFEGGSLSLEAGSRVIVTTRPGTGSRGVIPVDYAGLPGDVEPGDRILLDDGNLELRVEAVEGDDVRCRVVRGGELRDRKGMNLPGTAVSIPALTDRDRDDAAFAVELGVEFLALSFVRSSRDVEELRELVAGADPRPWIISKIEKPQALDDIDGILEASDGIMVARGDLGVELPPEMVPMAQSQLVDLGRDRARPVIVATQMLESMVDSARPTRAEVSDVSGAVRSGADAVMLSAETAVGRHPVAAVEMMDRVARETEGYLWQKGAFGGMVPGAVERSGPLAVEDAVGRATAQLSRDLMVRAIVVFTRGGWTALQASAGRPQAPVLAVTPHPATLRRLSLLWGVVPIQADESAFEEADRLTRDLAVEAGLAEAGHHVLQLRGFHHDPRRNRPTLTVLTV